FLFLPVVAQKPIWQIWFPEQTVQAMALIPQAVVWNPGWHLLFKSQQPVQFEVEQPAFTGPHEGAAARRKPMTNAGKK
ncbi:MAG: hypothetical protein ACYC8T_08410, partial [Myxococcaceae bacterium]